MLQSGHNVQIVCCLADLRELFLEWKEECQAMKPAKKEDVKLTADAAAMQLGISKISLWRWAKQGLVEPIKIGKKVHYWQSDIDKLLRRKEG